MARTAQPGANPSGIWEAVTPSDSVNFTNGICRGLWVGGAGIVQAVDEDGNVVAFTCPAGACLPIMAKRVNSTSTTATLIVALF